MIGGPVLILAGVGAALATIGFEPILWVLLLLLASGFFSGSETATVSAQRIRLEARAAEGHRDARVALRLLDDPTRMIATTLVGTNLATVGASAIATAACLAVSPERGVALATVLLTPLALFVGEILPKALFRSHATFLFRVSAPTLRVFDIILAPLVGLASGAVRGLLWVLRIPAAERRPLFRREDLAHAFLHAISLGEREGEDEGRGSTLSMAVRTLDLRHRKVREAMVPLPENRTLPADATIADARELIRESHAPFLAALDAEGRVEGFVAAKVLLGHDLTRRIGDFARPAYVLNPDDALDDAVGAFRRSQQSIGLVRDRDGQTMGVVTAEDVLEEIVGELRTDPGGPGPGP